MTASKFDNFTTKDFVYKTVNGHDLETTVCVPKNVSSGKHPVLVHLHGGFLIVGDKMFEPWFATWLIQFAEAKGAIIVSPNYRLLPEATGQDILEDLTSFYAWVTNSLPAEVSKISSGAEADLSQILVAGESAGGYLAVQSAIHFPQLKFKAIISQYGMLDMEHPHFTQAFQKEMSGAPHLPVGVVDDYRKALKPDAVRSSTIPPGLWSLIVETVREGRILEFLGKDDSLFPMKLLNAAKELPAFWIIHGETDDFVPIEISTNFVNKLKETHPTTPVFYTVKPEPHGFDADNVLTDDFVKEGTDFVGKYWPQSMTYGD